MGDEEKGTKIIKLDPQRPDEGALEEAGRLIAEGELVAFPTETVYGLGADALRAEAAAKIYAAKGRPSDNPLIVHIAETEDLPRVAREVPAQARTLADAFWPGPLTLIVNKNAAVPAATTGGLDTVAVRMPDHVIARELIRKSGCLIAAPSANLSGRPSPTEAAHVWEDLSGRIAMILDGGPVAIGLESTIVDLTEERPMILRPGYITRDMLEAALGGPVEVDPGLIADDDTRKPKAPGMKYRHYAPRARLVIVDGAEEAVVSEINRRTCLGQAEGRRVAVIATDETAAFYEADVVLSIGSRADDEAIARKLYGILRKCDELDVSEIYSESYKTPRLGQAIMNRLLKAAGYTVIQVSQACEKG